MSDPNNRLSPLSMLGRFPVLSRLGQSARKIPVVQQLSATECGLACLAMVLGYHGKEVRREELRGLLIAGRAGTTAKQLVEAARHYGLRTRAVKIDLTALEFLKPGAILHWGFSHFIVFERLRADGADIIDPAVGRRRVSLDELGKSFTGVALLFEPGEQFVPTGEKARRKAGSLVRKLWEAGEWGRVATMSAFLFFISLIVPFVTGVIIDRVLPRGDRHLLLVISIAVAAVVVFQFLAMLVRAHLLLHLRTAVDVEMSVGVLSHMISLPFTFFQQRSGGDLLMRLNTSAVIRDLVTATTMSTLLDGAVVIVYFAVLFALSPWMALVVLVAGAIQVGMYLATRRRRRDLNATLLARQARAYGYQVEMLAGMETLKSMGCEERAEERWVGLFVDTLNTSLESSRLGAAIDAVLGTLKTAAPLCIMCAGALLVLDGGLSLGDMLAVNAIAIGVLTPLSNLVLAAAQLQLIDSYVERIDDVREAPPEQEHEKVQAVGALRGQIELAQVSFRYGPMEPLVVRDVSIKIAPGQFIALVGRSGSGKSSLASLLLGLYMPTSGCVLYDGADLRTLDLRGVRQQLGIVTQRAQLFNSTIRENIALPAPDLPLEAVITAAQRGRIHDEIAAMPMKYETLLSDGGGSLSGGQRQRIALARALVNEPVVLLLDEATSALDAITEREVQDELAKMRCTRIVIAHRLSTIQKADLILVMDKGAVVEQGTHAELMARDGMYSQLVATQLDASA
jgi:ATP-binding cassette, subfamily B, bacterial